MGYENQLLWSDFMKLHCFLREIFFFLKIIPDFHASCLVPSTMSLNFFIELTQAR